MLVELNAESNAKPTVESNAESNALVRAREVRKCHSYGPERDSDTIATRDDES
jgi:hypothetical protein